MKLALAQIDLRLGDLEGARARIADQARLAAAQGADLLCTPAPLFAGMQPTALVGYPNYEHALLRCLRDLARETAHAGAALLVPAVVPLEGFPLMEAFLLREGRCIPLRAMAMARSGRMDASAWEPPVFDVAGTRVAAVFDAAPDARRIPRGCDVAVLFQTSGFCASDGATHGAAGVADGHFADEAVRAGSWLAYMAPVGAFDETVFAGASFVMDDAGSVVAAAPAFEEDLLVCEVRRGTASHALDARDLPRYERDEWLWEALRLYVRDTVEARGRSCAVLPLEGDLPSSLLAALAVDALGSRNVVGVLCARSDVFTPRQEELERRRVERVRELASNLNMRLVERDQGDASRRMDRDVPSRDGAGLRAGIDALCVADVAHGLDACILSPLTKTDAALAPGAALVSGAALADAAPFGDIYLTALEFLARHRNALAPALPAGLVSLAAVEERLSSILAAAVASRPADAAWTGRMAALLAGLEPAQVDGALEAHVDRDRPFEEVPLSARSPEAAAVLLMLVRRGEARRRSLPPAPMVSARPFAERAWPASLAWSDLGRDGEEPERLADLVEEESHRIEELGAEHGQRVRGEIRGLLGSLLGLTPEQQAELASEEGQRRMRESAERFESQLRQALSSGDDAGEEPEEPFAGQGHPTALPGRFPFFSQN